MGHKHRVEYVPPIHQALAELNQANPVQNTYYTILDTTLLCRIYNIAAYVETTGETLQLRVTIDGQVLVGAEQALGASVLGYSFMAYTGIISLGTTALFQYRAFLIEGRSVKVEVRKTTAAGTGTLHGYVVYGSWP